MKEAHILMSLYKDCLKKMGSRSGSGRDGAEGSPEYLTGQVGGVTRISRREGNQSLHTSTPDPLQGRQWAVEIPRLPLSERRSSAPGGQHNLGGRFSLLYSLLAHSTHTESRHSPSLMLDRLK